MTATERGGRGVMTALARDVRGATLAIMGAALIPFCGMVGGGIDLARMYITKTRLQHACDAGSLAGRKQMGSGTWGDDDRNAANKFFDANYRTGAYGSSDLTRTFAENAGKVTGTASATVPMTLMRVLGKTTETLSVSCDAEMRLPNTDIMFTLDVTGSMGDTPAGDTQSKMASLRIAVKCFYEIVARYDTDATCTTGVPSGGTGGQVQIRFGFMPYSTNVNVGRLLKPEWVADSALYQTRVGRWWDFVRDNTPPTTTYVTQTGVPQYYCNDATAAASGYNSYNETYSTTARPYPDGYPDGTRRTIKRKDTNVTGWSANNSTCFATQTTTDRDYLLKEGITPDANDIWGDWHYGQLSQSVSALKNGTGWNAGFNAWVGNDGAQKWIDWDGCIEERATVRQASYSPIPSGALDLDIDTLPVAGNPDTQWKPALPGLIYTRRDAYNYWTLAQSRTNIDYGNGSSYSCPVPAQKLQTWGATDFQNYVNTLQPTSNTYHDIGLIWAARLMSAGDSNGNGGLFASENKFTPQGGEIDRHMIFMTDGDTCTGVANYQAYGVAWYDRRQTDASTAPTDGCTNNGTLTQQVNARTTAICTAIKNKNITLWVVTFGYVDPTTVTRLQNCATSGRYFSANNAAQLQATFASIANQISQLRLTQ